MPELKLTKDSFLAFVKTKPEDETYQAGNGRVCALAQFLHSIDPEAEPFASGYKQGEEFTLYPEPLYDAAVGTNGDHESYTWGALAHRLEALSAEDESEPSE